MLKRIKAITLLECALSLVVIASITTMAVRYYMITIRQTRVAQAIGQVKRLSHVSYEWLQTQKQANFADQTHGTALTLQALLDNQLIQQDIDTLDPWGGRIEVAPNSDGEYVKITLNNIPQPACRNLVQQLKYINHHTSDNDCKNAKDNKFIAEF